MRHVLLLEVFSLWFVCSAQSIQPLSPKLPTKSARESQAARAAQAHPNAIRLQGLEYVIPELILGGEWTSTIKLTNRGGQSIPTTNVFFYDNLGNPMRATFQASDGSFVTDVGFSFSLSIGTLIEATFVGSDTTQFGHAIIGCSAAGCGTPGLYGEVTLRNRNSTRPDFESVFPFEQPASLQYLVWDGRNGITTVLYLVNNTLSATLVSLDFLDSSNSLIRTVNVTMNPSESQILTLHVLVQETIGIQGTLAIRGQSTDQVFITATALRINPSNSFTPMRTFVPTQ
jgi:hypothetical protein